MNRLFNAYCCLIGGGSVLGGCYGSINGVKTFSPDYDTPYQDYKKGQYLSATLTSVIGATYGAIGGAYYGAMSPILGPALAYSIWKERKQT